MRAIVGLIIGISNALLVATSSASEKQPVGWIEHALIFPGGFALSAKMDTGADNSSLSVRDFTINDRDGQEWVKFTVIGNDGKAHEFERKLVRLARIKRNDASAQERPVVMLGICVGKHIKEVEVNLVDRRKYKYPLLVGRNYISGAMVVDPSKKYTVEPECRGAPIE